VTEAVALMPGRYHARFRLVGTMGSLMPRIPAWVGRLEPLDAGHCVLTLRADTWEDLAARALLAGAEMTLLEPEELRPHLHGMAERLRRAAT
jgi:predicted DNA-binding transcriptional regulator YafY